LAEAGAAAGVAAESGAGVVTGSAARATVAERSKAKQEEAIFMIEAVYRVF
jgi:hypothetical protein